MDEDFTANLRKAKTVEEFLNVIDAAENEKDAEEEKKEEEKANAAVADTDSKLILAVTGCPTGIAHTYMAAEAIEKKAKELGYRVKVETRGSGGAKNVLTKAEIEEAAGIIVAADTQVPMDRFAGKPVIQCKVADGISKAEELITKAASGHAPVYEANGKATMDDEEGKDSIGHQIYKNLMNGVSHMLPFVVGGGILIAIAFLIDGFSVDLNSLPLDQRADFGTITPLAAMFKSIGGTAVVLGILLGGMMSVDMGGPVNKAAYVFGTASIAAGNYNIMAAVMVGGMVPPTAIALATIFFKNKFTADERKAGPTNFIMGLSFITEGAIPFAAADPLHVLPACIVGSAVAGGLSMAFNCTLMAPHGGIFVFLTVGNPLLYLVSLAVGSAISCVLLGILKKKAA